MNEVIRLAERKKAELDRLKNQGIYSTTHFEAKRKEFIGEVHEARRQEIERLEKSYTSTLEGIKKKYVNKTEDPAAELLRLTRYQARIKALSPEEIEAEGYKYTKDGHIANADEVDALTAELRQRGIGHVANMVREASLHKFSTTEPWTLDPEYRKAEQELKAVRVYVADLDVLYGQDENKSPTITRLSEIIR